MHPLPIHQSETTRLAPEENIFRDGHFLNEREFLINHRQPGALGIGDATEARHFLAH